jgi:putative tricarboxylic transport membrane protein
LLPSKQDVKDCIMPVLRGTFLGGALGILPGNGAVLGPFASYTLEKKIAKDPRRFGNGAIEGVAGPEAANNAGAQTAFIPLLTLGLPFAAPGAIMLAGLRMHNVEPGPMLFTTHPEVFWTFIAAMYLGNIMLLILNLPLVGLFAKIAVIRPQVLMPVISLICLVGVYSVRNSLFDVWVMIVAGVVGYFLRHWRYPIAPFIIGVVLGPTTENSLRQTLMMFRGDVTLVSERPLSLALLTVAALFLAYRIAASFSGKKVPLFVAEDKTL